MKKKKYTLICSDCKSSFQATDSQTRVCNNCIKKEQSRVVPRGPKPIDEMFR